MNSTYKFYKCVVVFQGVVVVLCLALSAFLFFSGVPFVGLVDLALGLVNLYLLFSNVSKLQRYKMRQARLNQRRTLPEPLNYQERVDAGRPIWDSLHYSQGSSIDDKSSEGEFLIIPKEPKER
jgi:hypothetical protein